jgi:protein-disulfide isomerase
MQFDSRTRWIAAFFVLGCALLIAQDWKTATTLPGVDLTGMAAAKAANALRLLRDYDCTCGCGMKVAQCRVEDPGCSYSKGISAALVGALEAGKSNADALAAARASKFGTAPAPPKMLEDAVPVATDGSPVEGPQNAAVTLVEFSDFQCPFCYLAAAQLSAVVKAFPTQVKLVFRQYPLDSHSQAALAAAAAIAAHRQGKFWPLHDAMFAHRQELSRATITALAAKTGMDMKRFEADWSSKETAATVARDVQDGDRAGVDGTPTVFVNGQHYHGSLELQPMRAVIEGELKKKTGK